MPEDLDRGHPARGGAGRDGARLPGQGDDGRGTLVSDDMMIGIVRERLSRPDAQRASSSTGSRARWRRPRRSTRCSPTAAAAHRRRDSVPEEELVRRLATRGACAWTAGTMPPADDGRELPASAAAAARAAQRRRQRRGAAAAEGLHARHRAAGGLLPRRPTFRWSNGAPGARHGRGGPRRASRARAGRARAAGRAGAPA